MCIRDSPRAVRRPCRGEDTRAAQRAACAQLRRRVPAPNCPHTARHLAAQKCVRLRRAKAQAGCLVRTAQIRRELCVSHLRPSTRHIFRRPRLRQRRRGRPRAETQPSRQASAVSRTPQPRARGDSLCSRQRGVRRQRPPADTKKRRALARPPLRRTGLVVY